MKNIILVVVVSCMLSIGLFAESKGEKIFMSKCVACHAFKGDVSKSNRLAPPMSGVMLHMNESFKTKGDIKEHILDFVINPTKDKALCPSVKKFGLMASQKGLLSDKELNLVADWIINDLRVMSKKEHNKNKKGKHKNEK